MPKTLDSGVLTCFSIISYIFINKLILIKLLFVLGAWGQSKGQKGFLTFLRCAESLQRLHTKNTRTNNEPPCKCAHSKNIVFWCSPTQVLRLKKKKKYKYLKKIFEKSRVIPLQQWERINKSTEQIQKKLQIYIKKWKQCTS